MGYQIIKQPNGKYCTFSSIVDNVISYDMSEEEIIEDFVEESKKDIERKVKTIIKQLESGEKPYFQFTMSYSEMMETIKGVHGAKEMENVKAEIE